MPQTIVFFVETRTDEQSVALCRWVDHFYEQGKRVQVVASSSVAAQHLDQLMWTFAQGSFIPHRIGSSGQPGLAVEPVIITVGEAPVKGAAVVLSDGPLSLDFMQGFDTVVHFVLLDDAEKRLNSRSLWQAARERGIQVNHIAYVSKGRVFPSIPK
ncbi:MAG TPA: DNA polymerase III subunit chi [Syntrophobacteraceae bacterium]|nr:DNA polymerase III subunit chi [Syntrophobacteraceae bacterium]